MYTASVLLLLLSCGIVLGCDTGSTAQNVSTTGWKGQKVGKSSNVSGPVPSSTTGTAGNIEEPSQNLRTLHRKRRKTSTAIRASLWLLLKPCRLMQEPKFLDWVVHG